MDDYISRKAAIRKIDFLVCPSPLGRYVKEGISELPAADVRPVVMAHWIYHEDDYGYYCECSNCHDEFVVYGGGMEWKFCPNCGADLRGDRK